MSHQEIKVPAGPVNWLALCLLCNCGSALAHPEEACRQPDVSTTQECEPAHGTPLPVEKSPDPTYLAAVDSDIVFRSNTGYIDSALVRNQFRIRYDWNRDSEFPDRAEFIYGQCNCNDPRLLEVSPGPASDFDYEELEVGFEYAFSRRLSVFTEIPYRDVDLRIPELPTNPPIPPSAVDKSGIGDIRGGIKYALIAEQNQYLTLQLKGYFDTGDESENLGTGHDAVEPGILYYRRLTDRWSMESEARWWHPTGNDTDYSGDVLRIGVGAAYSSLGSTINFSPVAELVGWYVTDGKKTNAGPPIRVEDADGDTIVNLKLGVRIRAGNHPGSLYLGYGFALTDEDWYDEVFRIEYRHNFSR